MPGWLRQLSLIPTRWIALAAGALAVPALLWHLGLMAFIGDEGIRSLVAFEMWLSGDFLQPTLNGEAYLNKPPLYNWILLGSFRLFGYFGEFPARLTTVVFLLAFAVSVWAFSRKHFGNFGALLLAFMLLTSGRILFWDSLLGLIDTCFSWVVFLNFMLLYALGKRQQWLFMFVGSYLLAGLAFLLKGLPAAVFQAISIPVALHFHGVLRRRYLSWSHLGGLLPGLALALGYYILLARQQSIQKVFATLFEQSMQRTPTHYSLGQTLLQLVKFPLDQCYHFLPWTVLVLVCFHRRFWQWLQENDFVRFNFWLLVANLPVYWVSSGTYPRYLLMFIPLFHAIFLYGYNRLRGSGMNESGAQIRAETGTAGHRPWQIKSVETIFLCLTAIAALGAWSLPFLEKTRNLPGIHLTWICCAGGITLCVAGIWADRARRLWWLVPALLLVRLVFDLVILPLRLQEDKANWPRVDMPRLASHWGDRTWWIYGDTETHQVARFYISRDVGNIVRRTQRTDHPKAIYLVDRVLYPDFPGQTVDSLRLETGQKLYLMTNDK